MRHENWKNLNPIEKAEFVRRYVEKTNKVKAAHTLGISKNYIDQLLAILKLPAEIQEKLRRREIGIYDAFKLARNGASPKSKAKVKELEEVRQLKERLSAIEEKNSILLEECERLMEENRRLKRQLSRNQEMMVVINRLQKIFAQLEKKEEEIRYLLRGMTVSGAHRMEILRWVSLLKRLEGVLEESLVTLDAECVDAGECRE